VIVAPLDKSITVFRRGNSKGFIGSIPIGGHWAPNSTVGVNALWKKAQNIAKKNNASDTINSIIPKFKPFWTDRVWSPNKVKKKRRLPLIYVRLLLILSKRGRYAKTHKS